MNNLLASLIPGSILFERYNQKKSPITSLGLFLLELAPYILLGLSENQPIYIPVSGFIFLYSFYELGYFWNDAFASEKEGAGRTIRKKYTKNLFYQFLIIRLFIITFVGCFIFAKGLLTQNIIVISAALCLAFIVHNTQKDSKIRLFTFIILNTLKIHLRLIFITTNSVIYLFCIFPHLFVRSLEYMHVKKILHLRISQINSLKKPIFLSWLILICILSPNLLIFFLPFLVLNSKWILDPEAFQRLFKIKFIK